jgi:hypothetical protein
MKDNAILVVASLLSILLLTLHITDDIVRGESKGRALEHCTARPRGSPLRDARAR